MSQTLEEYRWKNRVVLTNDTSLWKQQQQEFYKDTVGLNERKIVLLLFSQNEVRDDNSLGSLRFRSSSELLLIGLDGNVKVRKRELFTLKELFSIIDSMPMRATEIRKKGDG